MKTYPNIRDLERFAGITWHDLAEREPRLGELLWTARQAGVSCRRWSDVDRVFSPIRNTLVDLVGFAGRHQRHPVLGSAGPYQVAYWKLYDAVAGLLPCRAGGATDARKEQRGETAGETCPTEAADTVTARM
jgi:hypothetical protein